MATTYFKGRGTRKRRTPQRTVKECIDYSTNPEKTENFKYVTINNMGENLEINSEFDIDMFISLINRHHKKYEDINKRKIDKPTNNNTKPFVMMTIRQSFLTGECSPEVAHKVGNELAKRVLGDNFKYVVCTHTNTDTVHNHIEFSPVDINLKKYKSSKFEHLKIQKISDEICEEFGLSTVIKSQQKRSKLYSKAKGTSYRKILKEDIDKTIKEVNSYDEFISKMRENYIVNTNRKHLTFNHRTNGQQKNIRSYTLGKSYTEEMLKFRCNPTPVINKNQKIKLRLRDIILLKGRKAHREPHKSYYESKRNIFYLSNAINVVVENKIGSYDDLKDRIETFNCKCNLLIDKLDTIDESINEINDIVYNLKTYEKYESLNEEYQNVILKKTFYKEHKEELDKFNEACMFLYDKNINLDFDNISVETYLHKLNEIQKEKEKISFNLQEVKKELNQIINTKKTIDNLYRKKYKTTEQIKEKTKEKNFEIYR